MATGIPQRRARVESSRARPKVPAIQSAKTKRAAAAPAIVALTASVLPADQQAALDAGCNAFLAKPYAASALTAVISRLAAERRGA